MPPDTLFFLYVPGTRESIREDMVTRVNECGETLDGRWRLVYTKQARKDAGSWPPAT